jgi:hypothetical protein
MQHLADWACARDISPLDRVPLEEAIDRDDAAPPPIGIAECRQSEYRLAFGVDRLTSALMPLMRTE